MRLSNLIFLCLLSLSILSCGKFKGRDGDDGRDGQAGEDADHEAAHTKYFGCSIELNYPGSKDVFVIVYGELIHDDGSIVASFEQFKKEGHQLVLESETSLVFPAGTSPHLETEHWKVEGRGLYFKPKAKEYKWKCG